MHANERGTPVDHDSQHEDKKHEIKIRIDRASYETAPAGLTGSQLRELANPNIGPERDLWLVVPGGQDRKIVDDEFVELKNGLRFFTAPGQINPGRGCE